MLLLALASAATLSLADVETDPLVTRHLGKYFNVIDDDDEPRPSGERRRDDGILTTVLTAPGIDHLVQTVFHAIELKLNTLVALRRMFSYENVAAGAEIVRKFFELLLRFCLIVNRLLGKADIDVSGLEYVLHHGVPAKPSEEYGVPAKPSNEYGVPAKPSEEYGVPAKPSDEYGVPAQPSNEYGVPSKPSEEYGVPAKPAEEYGVPAIVYGVPAPSKPQESYGVPEEEYRAPTGYHGNSFATGSVYNFS